MKKCYLRCMEMGDGVAGDDTHLLYLVTDVLLAEELVMATIKIAALKER